MALLTYRIHGHNGDFLRLLPESAFGNTNFFDVRIPKIKALFEVTCKPDRQPAIPNNAIHSLKTVTLLISKEYPGFESVRFLLDNKKMCHLKGVNQDGEQYYCLWLEGLKDIHNRGAVKMNSNIKKREKRSEVMKQNKQEVQQLKLESNQLFKMKMQ